jgi:hypothetical protein
MKPDISTLHKPDILTLLRHYVRRCLTPEPLCDRCGKAVAKETLCPAMDITVYPIGSCFMRRQVMSSEEMATEARLSPRIVARIRCRTI